VLGKGQARELVRGMRCRKTNKACFLSKERAMKVVERAFTTENWKNEHGGMPVDAYFCDDCSMWHLTKGRKRQNSTESRQNGKPKA
jgi:uncharacterized protein YlaI